MSRGTIWLLGGILAIILLATLAWWIVEALFGFVVFLVKLLVVVIVAVLAAVALRGAFRRAMRREN